MNSVHVLMTFIIVLSHVQFLPAATSSSNNKYLQGKDYNNITTTTSAMKPQELHKGPSCTSRDLSIGQTTQSQHEIPVYTVQIINTCLSKYGLSNIHFHCGAFASARLVNPRVFKRLSYDDCLVNNGLPLKTGQAITFSYSNTFKYPISFKYATFC
ncbi:hypothetical protein L1987_30848 [Smallanthus sonchifolius]|uniref:Uncharacterized protein n=1 Tax=Smallanthus sonchifolius TaxID=185202 RepID=A0ACB9I6M4_9ASTR|nr:hypothetical protein L1987_30848 [Smallanthus sonchifolius]